MKILSILESSNSEKRMAHQRFTTKYKANTPIQCLVYGSNFFYLAYYPYTNVGQHTRKANALTAHLVFADKKVNAEKTKRAVFCQRSDNNGQNAF
ncbi:hypothetical protein FF125_02175 [Aureibaculum algae]|uniref:Uncharacterized protein n=1 Tax=Aureibaculum algae TaxID=2584122 RepID=A0A5B7TRT1_9FLAO|nr:hypothetical protein [Aureibaculum algae]QCX37302.1 hypothetical protein FF125_02175 [Aureibaculum algae]